MVKIENLSHLAKDSITATSQSAGNGVSSSERLAHTAPGSDPVDPTIARQHRSDPTLTMTDYTASPVEVAASGADVTPDHATRSNPFNRADGTPWVSGSDTDTVEITTRSMLKRGGGWANRNEI